MNSPWLLYSSLIAASLLQGAAMIKGCVGRGKYITWPMVKLFAYWYAKRLVKKRLLVPGYKLRMLITPAQFRFWQWGIIFMFLIWILVLSFAGLHLPRIVDCIVYWWPWALLHADDLLSTIDKDKWKKRWMTAKNKIKWKWVPAPVPVRT